MSAIGSLAQCAGLAALARAVVLREPELTGMKRPKNTVVARSSVKEPCSLVIFSFLPVVLRGRGRFVVFVAKKTRAAAGVLVAGAMTRD